jgi:hypothetical protein
MWKSCAAAMILVMAATGVSAQDSAEEPEAKAEKKICRTKKMTGSLTRRTRTCLTQAQWDRLAEGARKNVDNLARDANQAQGALSGGTGGGAGGPGGL